MCLSRCSSCGGFGGFEDKNGISCCGRCHEQGIENNEPEDDLEEEETLDVVDALLDRFPDLDYLEVD
jgi:hypothetical protein